MSNRTITALVCLVLILQVHTYIVGWQVPGVDLTGGAQIVGDGSGGVYVKNGSGTTLLAISSAGNATLTGYLDAPDIEVDTISARDGTLAQTIASSTGQVTASAKVTASQGLQTGSGYGIGVGTTAPTTNAVALYSAVPIVAPANTMYLFHDQYSRLSPYLASGVGSVVGSTASFNTYKDVNGNTFISDGGTVPILAAGTQFAGAVQFTEIAAPSNPASNLALLFLDSSTNHLSAMFDAGTAIPAAEHP